MEFDDSYPYNRIFTSLVRPILEYAAVVWSPSYLGHTIWIESVRKKFLIFVKMKL